MSSTNVIQDILFKGKQINDELTKKVGQLHQDNSKFHKYLTERLNSIINIISNFKTKELKGISDAKIKLNEVTGELTTTKQTLENTKTELERVKTELDNVKNEMLSVSSKKNELEQQIRNLDDKIKQIELQRSNEINGVREEMSKRTTQEKKAMEEEFNKQITNLNNEKQSIQNALNEAKNKEQEAINNLTSLQKEQDNLTLQLGTINSFLAKQLELISNIGTDKADSEEYNSLLDTIEKGLTGIMNEINMSSSNTNTNTNTNTNKNNSETLYDKFMKLDENKKQEIYDYLDNKYGSQYSNAMKNDIKSNDVNRKNNINNILSRYYNGDLLKGGRRVRKSCKLRVISRKKGSRRKTRKTRVKSRMRGGYIYNANKQLDKESSIISETSHSKTKKNRLTKL